jgi:hypothetical protein
MRSTLHRLGLVLLLAAAGLAPLAAQETRGEILGRITDPSGAVIPGAAVRAVNTETNGQTPATTNRRLGAAVADPWHLQCDG